MDYTIKVKWRISDIGDCEFGQYSVQGRQKGIAGGLWTLDPPLGCEEANTNSACKLDCVASGLDPLTAYEFRVRVEPTSATRTILTV